MSDTKYVCIYADRHGCGDREAHPYICSGGPVCDLHKPGAVTTTPSADTGSPETVPPAAIAA